jgi:hypothetical protein
MKGSVASLEELEVLSNRLVLFVREEGRDQAMFSSLVRSMAQLASPHTQELKDAVLELVRLAKLSCFSSGCAVSLVLAANDKVVKACQRARRELGEQSAPAKPEEPKVKTWSGVHAAPKSNVPSTWEEMQHSGVLYGDGHQHQPVVVTSTEHTKPAIRLVNNSNNVYRAPPQNTAPKPDPARDRALEEIDAMYGEDAKFDDIIAKSPRQQAEIVQARNKAAIEKKLAEKHRKSAEKSQTPKVATAAPQPGPVPSAKINSVLPETRGGLRVVK